MRLLFSPRAALDLEEIGDFIARGNPSRAISFIDEIRARCLQILEMPTAFPARNDLAVDVRMAIHGNYLILFRVLENTVRIERIVHGARRVGELP